MLTLNTMLANRLRMMCRNVLQIILEDPVQHHIEDDLEDEFEHYFQDNGQDECLYCVPHVL